MATPPKAFSELGVAGWIAQAFVDSKLTPLIILFAIGTEELLAHPEVALAAATRWAFIGGLIVFLASESAMAHLFTHHTAWERLTTIGALGIVGVTLGGVSAAVLGAVACVILVAMLSVETLRHRDALRQLR